MKTTLFAVCLWLASATFAVAAEPAAKSTAPQSPLSPEESLNHFVLADANLQIEIVAAEPEVIDPVAIQFDEHGRMWVVEMRDYPTGPKEAPPPLGGPDAKPLSRIKLLEDKDSDGRFETAHLFADNLLFATGVQPWDGGVIVSLAGEVAYFKDTDGDLKADVRETWFTGFAQVNSQLRANHPTFGPDGWIYVANGLRGGDVIAVKKDWPSRLGLRPDAVGQVPVGTESQPTGVSHDPANPKPVSLAGRDFKFDPLTGRYEAIAGNGQFGLTFDAWGNRFVCDNRHPCRHVIFEEDFIRRCPHVAFPAVVHDVIPPEDKNQVFPLTSAWTTSNLHAGTFTAACGVCVYTGDWLPEEFRGNVFVCEPTGNLVQRAILEPDGVTFKSRNPYRRAGDVNPPSPSSDKPDTQNGNDNALGGFTPPARRTQEFLASRDDWFRPVDLQNGPDGALYVVDMYRAVIEHPEWVPDELKNRPDTWLGNDKGRIFRITMKGARPKRELAVSVANLDSSFNSTNGWHRTTASRLWRQEFAKHKIPSLIPALRLEPRTSESRCLALQSEIADLCPPSLPHDCLGEKEAHARSRAAEFIGRVATGKSQSHERPLDSMGATLIESLLSGSNEDVVVGFRLLQFLVPFPQETEVHEKRCGPWLRRTALRKGTDPWMTMLLVAAYQKHGFSLACSLAEERLYRQELSTPQQHDPAQLFEKVGEFLGSQNDSESAVRSIATWSDAAISPRKADDAFLIAVAGIQGAATTFGRRGMSLSAVLAQKTRDGDPVLNGFIKLVQTAKQMVTSAPQKYSEFEIRIALRFLSFGKFEEVGGPLQQSAELSTDHTLRLAAVGSFASFQKPEVDTWLIERYPSETPAIRRAILAALFASKERQLRLLNAVEQGQIAATELDPVRVNQLTQAKDETVRERAKTVLAAAAPASRKEVLEAYQPALTLKADPQRGREVFQKHCVTCHRVADLGVNVAPDISDTRTKKPEQLLLDILDPNKAIDANYFAYAVVTKDGKTESGVISAETATSITLKQPEGKTLTLLRTDIEALRNTGLSLMPVGVEKTVDQQAMADLIFWLKNWRYLDGKVPATSLK